MQTIDEVEQHLARHEPGWSRTYGIFAGVLQMHRCKVGVEVGVAFGGHSEAMLKQADLTKLYGVDAYLHRAGYDDMMNLPQDVFDALHARTVKRLSGYGDRFQLIRLDSVDAAAQLAGPLDFAYLDADHSYEGVFQDLCSWFPKLRPGGILGGHDYGHQDFPGVKQAVDEFTRRFGWRVVVEEGGVWWTQTAPFNVSFIIPAFNAERTIGDSIASILDGNLAPDDEIVVVDDCSTDGTAKVVAGLADRQACIRLVSHRRNKGGGAARNTAIEHADNALIFCLDSDNVLVKNSVPGLSKYLVETGADVAAFQAIRYFTQSTEQVTHTWEIKPGRFTFEDCLRTITVPGASGNYLYSRESWQRAGGYPESSGALDTWGFGFRQLATGSRLIVQPATGYFHRHGHDSYWVRQSRQGNVDIKALQLVLPYLDLIARKDVDYIMGPRGRYRWFMELDQRPLHLPRPPSIYERKMKGLARRVRSVVNRLKGQ